MYEKYELPIRFTEEQRKKYAEWGIKKGKVLMPMAAVTIGIDLLTVLWVVGRVWLIRESDPIWFQIICQNDGIGEISSTIAIILTFLILKPIPERAIVSPVEVSFFTTVRLDFISSFNLS